MGWSTVRAPLSPGRHLWQGDEACAEGAIAAGCRFYAGYPITPASEIMQWMAHRFHEMGEGIFIQMEDEIASVASVIGASWAGAKAMTATSGPGFTLMLENIGYAIMTETPCVVVDVQRAGPSTGQATRPASGDVMEARWGAHGDFEIIALSPWSAQEMFDLTVRAFNLAERFRVPVFVLADEAVGHMRENVVTPAEIQVYERERSAGLAPFGSEADDGVPPMPAFGQGERLLVTGSTHDPWGYRKVSDSAVQDRLTRRLVQKIRAHQGEIIAAEPYMADEELDVLVVAYGFTARSARHAVKLARQAGIRAGLLRLITFFPFAEEAVLRHGEKARNILIPEMNQGQVVREVQRAMAGNANRVHLYAQTNGEVICPLRILSEIKRLVET
ncbi:MAG: 2-oxoacid:acceptor oxidoreductase subunit alpha [Chloroflexi bacterium]|nr:2-oxoacid:acceptor oxidoreductase subunit alpha [Chloroflexota bacterium]